MCTVLHYHNRDLIHFYTTSLQVWPLIHNGPWHSVRLPQLRLRQVCCCRFGCPRGKASTSLLVIWIQQVVYAAKCLPRTFHGVLQCTMQYTYRWPVPSQVSTPALTDTSIERPLSRIRISGAAERQLGGKGREGGLAQRRVSIWERPYRNSPAPLDSSIL